MKVTVEVEIDIADIQYDYKYQYEEDPERLGNDKVAGVDIVVKAVRAIGVDSRGENVRVNLAGWNNLAKLVEEALHDI
jgi:hypothetical protein